MKWQVLDKSGATDRKSLISTLLKNRGLKTKKEQDEFLNPIDPTKITLKSLGIKTSQVKKVIERVKHAKKEKQKVIVYGDYDADGICATAIIWEALNGLGLDVLPHIPDRFEEGYGINAKSIELLKVKIPDLRLIVTVDNGIIAFPGIEAARELGIDVIVIDHHQKGDKKPTTPYILHTTQVCGSALAWFFAKDLGVKGGLELAAIGTIADQMPLVGVNRSVVKFGLKELNNTNRPGLKALLTDARIQTIGTYEVNYIIAPRINAMGRLAQGMDSLRLLCTKKSEKALELSKILSRTNLERQKIVGEVLLHVRRSVKDEKVIVLAHDNYHEGVIGLAAGKLVEEFYRPAIVLSKKGNIAKASARSISGFNIIEAIRSTGLILEGGGHPMAAGFSIETKLISKFAKKINTIAGKLLTTEILERKLKIDTELALEKIDGKLMEDISLFSPTGLGNPTPTFMTKDVEVLDARTVGTEGKHLKIKLRQNGQIFDSIFFGGGNIYSEITPDSFVAIVYQLEENTWNGVTSLQLKIKDIKIN